MVLLNITDEKCEGFGSSEEEESNHHGDGETETNPRDEDRELKNQLLRKYRGYVSSLKQELSKKKKKGKLPKEARQNLLTWWELHYKWPYPSVCICYWNIELIFSFYPLIGKMNGKWYRRQRRWHWLNQLGWTKNR